MKIPVINYVIVAIALLVGIVITLRDKSLTTHDRIVTVAGLLLTAVAIAVIGITKIKAVSIIAYFASVAIVVFTVIYDNHKVQKRDRQER